MLHEVGAVILGHERWQVTDVDNKLCLLCRLVPMLSLHRPADAPEVVVCDMGATAYLRSLHTVPWSIRVISRDITTTSRTHLVSELRELVHRGKVRPLRVGNPNFAMRPEDLRP